MTATPRPTGPSWPELGRATARHWAIAGPSRTYRGSGRGRPVLAREVRPGYDPDHPDDVGQVGARLHEVAGQVAGLAALLPDRATGRSLAAEGKLDADTLEGWVRDLRRIEGTLATVKATMVSLGEAVEVAKQAGMASTGQWFKDRFNTSSREASRQQQLAESLDQLPKARAAMSSGHLGPEQAAILGQAARRGRLGRPEQVEDNLLDTARRSSPERLRERIRRDEQAADRDALRRDENRQHALRRASCVQQEDGMWRLDALLPGIDGEMFATALNAYTTPDPGGTPRHLRRRGEQRTADGLVALARGALEGDGAPQSGGLRPHLMVLVPFDGPDPWHPERVDEARRWHDHRLLHEGADAPAGQPGLATTAAGTTLSPEASQRLLCDARVTRIVLSSRSEVLDVGRSRRTWTRAQRAAFAARDRGCRGPGCDRPVAWCDAHHVTYWADGGATDLDNGILLCRQHHRLVHEGGWTLTYDPATDIASFTDPTGTVHTTSPPRGEPQIGDEDVANDPGVSGDSDVRGSPGGDDSPGGLLTLPFANAPPG